MNDVAPNFKQSTNSRMMIAGIQMAVPASGRNLDTMGRTVVPDRGRFGVSICYDIWFPETTRTLTSLGVDVLLHPVLTGTTDRRVELAITKATAAMFLCYVFDVNGLEAGGIGHSIVVDSAGVVLHQARQRDEIFPITIDLDLVRHVRAHGANGLGQTFKSFCDRKVVFRDLKTGDAVEYLNALGPLHTITRH